MSQNFKEYKFYGKEGKPNAMKCSLETNTILTAVKETKHRVPTADGRLIHKKFASNPPKFQPAKRLEETRNPNNLCRRCGKVSRDEFCETHKQLMADASGKHRRQHDEASTNTSFPKLPMREQEKRTVIAIIADSQMTDGEDPTRREENAPETGETADTDEVTKITGPPTAAGHSQNKQRPKEVNYSTAGGGVNRT